MRVIAASLLVAVAPAFVSAAVTPIRRGISGFATWYYTQTGNAGACGAYLNDADFTVAMNQYQYEGSCGKYVTITANGKTTQAKVVDLCPEGGGNCHYGDMDMSPGLFAFFADLGTGKMPMEWDFTDGGSQPPPPPPPAEDTPYVEPTYTTPIQEEQPHVEPTPIVDSSPVENVVPTPTTTEVAPEVIEPAPAPTPTEPVVVDYVAATETTETTTECTTTTAEAEATTTPSLGEQLKLAIKDEDVHGLSEALLELAYLFGNHSDTTTTPTY